MRRPYGHRPVEAYFADLHGFGPDQVHQVLEVLEYFCSTSGPRVRIVVRLGCEETTTVTAFLSELRLFPAGAPA